MPNPQDILRQQLMHALHNDDFSSVDNLLQQDAIEKYALNEYYYKKIMNLNYFDEIEKFLLSQMSNEDLMELANSSKDWYDKLYYYEFLKNEDDKKMSK